jgi:hypothetical protein
MKKKPVKLIFNIPLGQFLVFVRSKLSFVRRDIAEFEKYGTTEDDVADTEAMASEWEQIKTDEELVGDHIQATQDKDELADKVRVDIRSIMTRVAKKFGEESAKYRKFGVSDLSHLEGGDLSYVALRVVRVAKEYLTQLESTGLTQAMITSLETEVKNYNSKLGVQEDAESERDIATEDRAEKANAIYRLIVEYCKTGRDIWYGKNEAKYNDYVIYDTPSGGQEEPPKEG